MKQITALPSFEHSAKKLSPSDKALLAESLDQFKAFVFRGVVAVGLGFKKINHDKYEFRAGLRLRVVVKAEGDTYNLALVGNHDEVRRYLRRFR